MIKHIKRVWNWLQESGAKYREETALKKIDKWPFPASEEFVVKKPQLAKATTRKEKKMPLKKGVSDKTRSANIAKEIKAGKKPSQAAAIGYAVQREAIAKKGAKAVKAKK